MKSLQDSVEVSFNACRSNHFPADSCFSSLNEASRFFETGSLGFSPGHKPGQLEGLHLRTKQWSVHALQMEALHATWYSDPQRFPARTVQFDHALLMENIPHEWYAASPPDCAC